MKKIVLNNILDLENQQQALSSKQPSMHSFHGTNSATGIDGSHSTAAQVYASSKDQRGCYLAVPTGTNRNDEEVY